MVVPGGVGGELSEQLSGLLVDDSDLEVLDEEQDVGSGVGSGVGSSDADVVESAVVADGDDAGVVDAVAADPLMGRGDAGGRSLGAGGVGRGRGLTLWGAVRAALVVVVAEGVRLGLRFGQ